jgi:GntR family transcriptional regulator, transcriptional repressor for pyruvate dehydrogenase complex
MAKPSKAPDQSKAGDRVTTEHVVSFVRELIERGALGPGDRLPPERELALQIGVSRPSVRAGLQALAAMGVIQARHSAGTFITDGPPMLATGPLSFLAAPRLFERGGLQAPGCSCRPRLASASTFNSGP